jgi:hypothetical protein
MSDDQSDANVSDVGNINHLAALADAIEAARTAVRAAIHNGESIGAAKLCSCLPDVRNLATVCATALQADSDGFAEALSALHIEYTAATEGANDAS